MAAWHRSAQAEIGTGGVVSAEILALQMQALCDLFALSRIQSDLLFRNDDYVARDKAKAIQKLVEALCKEVRGVAVPLVDSFGIPDFILRSPIGRSASSKDPYVDYLSSIGWA